MSAHKDDGLAARMAALARRKINDLRAEYTRATSKPANRLGRDALIKTLATMEAAPTPAKSPPATQRERERDPRLPAPGGSVRHVRRALSPEELARLLDAAERRPLEEATAYRKHRGVTPEQRVKLLALGRVRRLVYEVAAGTGLRRGELARLTWNDLDLEKRLLRIPAASSKSRKDQSLPLRSDLAEALAAHRGEGAAAKERVFAPPTFPNLRTLKRDLVAAGLAKAERSADGTLEFDLTDESGRSVDFHCLRMTAITGWVASGAHPRVVQALARHAKIETTMAVYTDVTLLDLRGAVEGTSLPTNVHARVST